MKPKDLARYILVVSPLFLGLVVGYTVKIPLSNIQILYLGIPLLAGALLFSALSYRITKFVVGKYGVDKETNPFARASFQRGTGGRDPKVMDWSACDCLLRLLPRTECLAILGWGRLRS